jgi:hypothetical protein
MKDSAKILTFRGKHLRTVSDLQAALFALRDDIRTGAVTRRESRPIEKEIGDRLRQFQKAYEATERAESPRPLRSLLNNR